MHRIRAVKRTLREEMPLKLSEIKETLRAKVILGEDKFETEVIAGAASDLMSDLLRNPVESALLLTGLCNVQVVRTSVIAGLEAVVFVRGKTSDADTIAHAQKHELPLLSTDLNMYSSCGRLFKNGLASIR